MADAQLLGRHAVQQEILARKIDRRRREVDAGDPGAAAREAHQIGADAAADLEQPLAAKPGKVDQLRQVTELVEAVLVEVVEERQGADRLVGHLQVVDAMVPVALYLVDHHPLSYNDRLMIRDLRRLADTKFDVLVVGAGFYGVTIAWDAAQRGLAVAIIDKDDFGAATSFNNLKTLHGGLRSLVDAQLQADAAVHPRAARAGAHRAAPGAPAAVRRRHDAQSDAQLAGLADAAGGQRCAVARPQ